MAPATIDLAPLAEEVFAFMLVFARTGGILMLVPAIGETMVPMRARLLLALALAGLLSPLLSGGLPPLPASPWALALLLGGEILVGIAFGLMARILFSAVQIAGAAIAMQTGLGFATAFDPSQGAQGALIGTFLSLAAVTLLMIADLHHLPLAGLKESYAFMPAGVWPRAEDLARDVTGAVGAAFSIGIALAAPFLVFGLVFHALVGLMSKVMPQLQVVFLALPVNMLAGYLILMALVGMVLTVFLEAYGGALAAIFAPAGA